MRRSKRLSIVAGLSACLFLCGPAHGQWATPSVDGSIGAGEYGSNNQLSNAGNTGQTWYLTWDATNLYVAVANANLSEGAVLYVGANPPTPAMGGSAANGNLAGYTYDYSTFSSLTFRAQFVTYFKDGYREYRHADGSGHWGNATAAYGSYASSANGNVRELAIPWTAIGGSGIPSSFAFFGYLTSASGNVYGQAPGDNPGARYFMVASTANGSSTPPFSVEQPAAFSAAVKSAFKHDTFDTFYRSPAGAATETTQVTLRFRTGHLDVDGVNVWAYLFDTASGATAPPIAINMPFDQNITQNSVTYDAWKVTLTLPSTTTVYYYKFLVYKGGALGFYSDDYLDDNDTLNKDGTGAASDSEPQDSFQITVYDPNFQTPAWLASAIVYQIIPDRFRNGDPTNDYCVTGSITGCPAFYGASNLIANTTWNAAMCDPYNSPNCLNNFNQFYGGDLLGIQNELDYLQTLGIDTLYLTPIFMARSYHRYDTDQYAHIDAALGGDAAYTAFQQELNRRGMRLILDGVFNHASSDGMYFDLYHRYSTPGACESLTSVYRTWFHFNDNNIPCTAADYPNWGGYASLAEFDHSVQVVKDFFYSGPDNIMQHWYNLGASGWRFDVAPDPNFPHAWWVGTRKFAKGYQSDGPLIGEIWSNASQWLAGDQLDSTMNYLFRKNVIGFVRNVQWNDNNNNGTNNIPGLSPSQFDHALRAVRDDYPPPATNAMLNLLDSHDTNRALYVLTILGDNGLTQAKQRLELAALFQFTYMGAPMVMYGDEVAINAPSLANNPNGTGAYGDPYSRAPYPWTDQNGNVNVYGPPDTSVLSFYTKLAHLRKQYPALSTGSYTTLLTGDTQQPATAANTYAFARTLAGASAVIALNNGAVSNSASIPVAGIFADGTSLQDALSGASYAVSNGSVAVTLAARTGVLLVPAPAQTALNLHLVCSKRKDDHGPSRN